MAFIELNIPSGNKYSEQNILKIISLKSKK